MTQNHERSSQDNNATGQTKDDLAARRWDMAFLPGDNVKDLAGIIWRVIEVQDYSVDSDPPLWQLVVEDGVGGTTILEPWLVLPSR